MSRAAAESPTSSPVRAQLPPDSPTSIIVKCEYFARCLLPREYAFLVDICRHELCCSTCVSVRAGIAPLVCQRVPMGGQGHPSCVTVLRVDATVTDNDIVVCAGKKW